MLPEAEIPRHSRSTWAPGMDVVHDRARAAGGCGGRAAAW